MNKEELLKTWINKGRRYYWSSEEKRNCAFSHYVWNLYNPGNKIMYRDGYNIHHIDGDKLNNSIDNLEKMLHCKHSSNHHLGDNNFNFNKKWSEERKREHSIRMVGNKNSLGYKQSKETIKKRSKSLIGNKNSLGYKQSKETIKKRKITKRLNKFIKLEEQIYCLF